LEPVIDTETMTIHYSKHHQAYVDNLNKAVAGTECATKTDPVSVDVADGDRYILYAYGTSMDDRQLLACPVTAGSPGPIPLDASDPIATLGACSRSATITLPA